MKEVTTSSLLRELVYVEIGSTYALSMKPSQTYLMKRTSKLRRSFMKALLPPLPPRVKTLLNRKQCVEAHESQSLANPTRAATQSSAAVRMGASSSVPKMESVQDSVLKTKNENGLHVFTVNLDANADGKGVSPWSIVAIVVITILALCILKKCLSCCLKHRPWANQRFLPYQIDVRANRGDSLATVNQPRNDIEQNPRGRSPDRLV